MSPDNGVHRHEGILIHLFYRIYKMEAKKIFTDFIN